MINQQLNHFKITAHLGEGGMGTVYRAQDTRPSPRTRTAWHASNAKPS